MTFSTGPNRVNYEAVPLAPAKFEDEGSDLESSGNPSQRPTLLPTPIKRYRTSCATRCGIAANILAALINCVLFGLLAFVLYNKPDRNAVCAAHTTQWSPVLRDVDIKYKWKNFNGSFMQEDIYRKKGSPEVDAAWEALGVDYRAGVISVEDGPRSGLSHHHVQRSEKYGGGYFVNVEGLHHLHCLNLLRKSLYFNYDYYKEMGHHAFKNDEDILQLHITHCLDTIRQVLMCNVDTGLLGQVWTNPQEPSAFPDFNTKHMCKNYDDVKKWAESLQAPPLDKLPADYLKIPKRSDVFPHTP